MIRSTLLALTVLIGAAAAFHNDASPPGFPHERPPEPTYHPTWVTKTPGHYSTTDWQRAIDSVWGPGLPVQEKLDVLEAWRNAIFNDFACFNNLPMPAESLDTLVGRFRAEIEDTVSRGRFAGIMCHLAMQLMEAHSHASDMLVCDQTELLPGVPVQVVGGWRWDRHFGAGLTALEDSTLVVYSVAEDHPFAFEPGDIVLGYDRRPWTELCRELRDAQLPVRRNWLWGSKPESMTYSMLISAGLNWHLFDTVDIVRYAGGDTVHLPTSLMVGYEPYMTHSEQMDIPGVPKPNLDSLKSVTYGVMEHRGFAVGYIYSWTWTWTSSPEFREACSVLVSIDSLAGIIIDYRYNEGGYFDKCYGGYSFLFRTIHDVLDMCRRADTLDPYAMTPTGRSTISGNGVGYPRPVAVLLGPGCYSAGDYAAYIATLLDEGPVRTFGRTTNGAHIGGFQTLSIHADFDAYYAHREMRKCDDPTYYMTHRGFEPDTFVWHDRDSVAQGRDAVVAAAAEWVVTNQAVSEPRVGAPVARRVLPTLVRASLPLPGRMPATLLDISGRKVADLAPGPNDIRHVSPGVYFCRLTAGSASADPTAGSTSSVRKVVVTR